MEGAGAGAAPALSAVLTLDHDTPVASTLGSAHDVFVELLPTLLKRLQLSEDLGASTTRRVVCRGALYDPAHLGLKFSAEFKDQKLTRVRVMTATHEPDLTQIPAELGGTGLMAAATSVLDADDTRAAPVKRKRAKTSEPSTVQEAVERAIALASETGRADLVDALHALLKTC